MKWDRRLLQVTVVVAVLYVAGASVALAELPTSLDIGNASAAIAPVDSSSTASVFVRMIGALLLCLGVFAGGMYFYRRHAGIRPRSASRRMTVVERLAITQKSGLYLVSLDGKELLVTSGPDNLRVVSAPIHTKASFDESLADACDVEGVYNA